MSEHLLIGLAAIIVLGVLAQWLAWRLHLPGILILLLAGFLVLGLGFVIPERVADFLEFAEIMVHDAWHRNESCGGHFREEYQTEDGEAKRDDEHFAYVAAWEYRGVGEDPVLHKEELEFEEVQLTTRSYK